MPYEYSMLIDDILRKRGVRKDVRLIVTTPEPQPMPVAGKAIGDQVKAMLADRGIEYLPNHKPKTIDKKKITYENGFELEYDVLGTVPPHRAPRVVRDAGLTDASGFVPVDLYSFRASVPDVYAIGDVASLKLPDGRPHPKAGFLAEAQAIALANAIKAEIYGGISPKYEGRGACFVDTGNEEAAAAEMTLITPEGPQVLLKTPSKEGLEGKRGFERERFLRWFGK
jgi:sulfide:quinone oxidoreductase